MRMRKMKNRDSRMERCADLRIAEPEALNKYGAAGVYSPAGNGLSYDQRAQGAVGKFLR